MERVLVIGCSAAGKSTVARRLGEVLGVEVIHLDKVLWKPGCKLVEPHEEPGEIEDLLDRPRWVIDGNYTASLPMRLMKADTVVLVDFNRVVCLGRAMKRLWTHWGKTRPDMGAACPETFNLSFLKWIWEYPEKERPELIRLLREHGSHAEVVVLRNQKEMDAWLETLVGGEGEDEKGKKPSGDKGRYEWPGSERGDRVAYDDERGTKTSAGAGGGARRDHGAD